MRAPYSRRSPAEVQAARDELLAARATVTQEYAQGESLASIARRYRVDPEWLREQFEAWGGGVASRSVGGRAYPRGVRAATLIRPRSRVVLQPMVA